MTSGRFTSFLLLIFISLSGACNKNQETATQKMLFKHAIPVYGNSWVVNNPSKNQEVVKQEGLLSWQEKNLKVRTFFRVEQVGELHVGLIGSVKEGSSTLKVTCGNQTFEVGIENNQPDTLKVGVFNIDEPGYHWVEFEGLDRTGDSYGEIKEVLIGGQAASGQVYFVKDDFYWGRRGPSVHLGYQVPQEAGNVKYFYSEITVPEGEDVIGSYYMANGFGQGYFGFQVNSPVERRVLFSVWSPYVTDNPQEIPEEDRIVLLKKGEGVYTGEFGNEGSGGQSYLKYNWKAGNTYKFLLKGEPAGNGSTDFTAWFFAPEENQWRLIASFRRPKTDTWLKSLYSFLENFTTHTGDQSRMAWYGNQWVYGAETGWTEITRIKFTADATARKDARLDYAGGAEGNKFFLKNCGFFSEKTTIDTFFEREPNKVSPEVDFDSLP